MQKHLCFQFLPHIFFTSCGIILKPKVLDVQRSMSTVTLYKFTNNHTIAKSTYLWTSNVGEKLVHAFTEAKGSLSLTVLSQDYLSLTVLSRGQVLVIPNCTIPRYPSVIYPQLYYPEPAEAKCYLSLTVLSRGQVLFIPHCTIQRPSAIYP